MPKLKGTLTVVSGSIVLSGSGGTTTIGTGSNSVTGSFNVSGSTEIIGSLFISSSDTLTNIGPAKFIGNLIMSSGVLSGSNATMNSQASKYSLSNGLYVSASGIYSHAEGYQSIASGSYSHAEGRNAQSIGDYSHTEGGSTITYGDYSHAEGDATQAIGEYSHAEGRGAQAIGTGSHAEGHNTLASGNSSHAEGANTQAIGDSSHAEGYGTIAIGNYQHVQGAFNITSSAEYAFIIGNGTDLNNESNLIFASGSEFQISGSLKVTGSNHAIQGLTTSSQTNIVTINPNTGLLYYTPSLIEIVNLNISCSNTSSATTTILSYGINVIEYSAITDYAAKLPQPTTGKKVTIVNKSLLPISLFPSNTGGQINNYPVDTPAIVPPDGKAYDFICIENPLPGAWVWSPPAIGQYDSGDISITTTSDAFGSYICAASLSGTIYAAERSGLFSTSGFAYNGLNNPLIVQNTPAAMPNSSYLATFKPSTPWNAITKIKIYSNIVPDTGSNPSFTLTAGSQYNSYTAGTTTFVASGIGGANSPFLQNPIVLNNVISGVVPSPGVTTNIGDPGTVWGEAIITPAMFYYGTTPLSYVGDQFISTDGVNDTWFTRYISAFLRHRVIGDVKFRFFIEYY